MNEIPRKGWWTVGARPKKKKTTKRKPSRRGRNATVDHAWETKDDGVVWVSDMKPGHLKNCVRYLQKRLAGFGKLWLSEKLTEEQELAVLGEVNAGRRTVREWIEIFNNELMCRGMEPVAPDDITPRAWKGMRPGRKL